MPELINMTTQRMLLNGRRHNASSITKLLFQTLHAALQVAVVPDHTQVLGQASHHSPCPCSVIYCNRLCPTIHPRVQPPVPAKSHRVWCSTLTHRIRPHNSSHRARSTIADSNLKQYFYGCCSSVHHTRHAPPPRPAPPPPPPPAATHTTAAPKASPRTCLPSTHTQPPATSPQARR